MASVDGIRAAIDKEQQTIFTNIDKYLKELKDACEHIYWSAITKKVYESKLPTTVKNIPNKLHIFDLQDTAQLFNTIVSDTEKYLTTILSFTVPEPSVVLDDPLSGWLGIPPFPKLTNASQLLTPKYSDPLIDTVRNLISVFADSKLLEEYRAYLRAATITTSKNTNTILSKNRYSDNLFRVPSILNRCLEHTITNQVRFEQDTDEKTMQYLIELLSKDLKYRALKYSVELDKIGPKSAIVYGEIYCLLADFITKKAKAEVDFFFTDFEARIKNSMNISELNTNNYIKYITSLITAQTANAEKNLKAIITNTTNTIKDNLFKSEHDRINFAVNRVVNTNNLTKYGMTLSDIVGKESNTAYADLVDQVGSITSYTTLLAGYRSLLNSYSQDIVAVATSKG